MSRLWLLALVLGLSACSSAPPNAEMPSEPVLRPTFEVGLPPEFSGAVGWVRVPVAIEPPLGAGPCGQATRLKIASRLDPPVEVRPQQWRFAGCFASPGNAFENAFIEVEFSDKTRALWHLADHIGPTGEFRYSLLVARDDVDGVVASILVILP